MRKQRLIGTSGVWAACLLLIALMAVTHPSVARADTYATYGNANTDTTFYVTSAGSATLTLSQSGMGLVEKQYIYNTANTTNEYAYAQYTVLYKGNQDAYWQQGAYWNEKTCTLNFPRADVYTVRVLPTNVKNMQGSQSGVWRNNRWITVPAWYASGVRNCSVSSVNPKKLPTATPRPTATPLPTVIAPLTLIYQDVNGNYMASEVIYLTPGTHTVRPNKIFSNYSLVGNSAYSVNVSAYGAANPSALVFLYQYQPLAVQITSEPIITPTPRPTAVPATPVPITGNVVTPVRWDTQYKPETSSHNPKLINSLANLYDNNPNTCVKWTVWTSEWKDDVPEFTAYFGGNTVGAVAFRNGDASSAKNYKAYARGYRYLVRVYLVGGGYHDTGILLKDSYSTNYQVFALDGVYDNVDRIEIFLNKYKVGGTNKNTVAISDILFYSQP
ncbi:MAG: hypothetical protein IJ189_03515 [Clostridia bacterium]|nr:hypothetical protein [Clostridia bacterium]